MSKQPDNENAQYIPERRTVQILEILKRISDEDHPVTQAQLLEAMKATLDATTENAGTLSKSIDEILFQINPLEYSQDKDDKYRIKYRGYKNDLIATKNAIKQDIRKVKISGKRAPSITGLAYIHDLNYGDLDKLIQAVCFSSTISTEDKTMLIEKLVCISSQYYSTEFFDSWQKKLRFNPKGIYSRTQRERSNSADSLGGNLKRIQEAINSGKQINFKFNEYDDAKLLKTRNYAYVLSPYYIVVYHDMYYLIGGMAGKDRAGHYRIDLMSDISIAKDPAGEDLKMIPMSKYKNLPQKDRWDPEKYMSEHLYMSYDEPRRIKIKIPSDRYTVLHDWFGDHYRKLNDTCEEGFDMVEIVSSPNMIVHWAMQYADIVQIMDKEIREKFTEKIKKLEMQYVKYSDCKE